MWKALEYRHVAAKEVQRSLEARRVSETQTNLLNTWALQSTMILYRDTPLLPQRTWEADEAQNKVDFLDQSALGNLDWCSKDDIDFEVVRKWRGNIPLRIISIDLPPQCRMNRLNKEMKGMYIGYLNARRLLWSRYYIWKCMSTLPCYWLLGVIKMCFIERWMYCNYGAGVRTFNAHGQCLARTCAPCSLDSFDRVHGYFYLPVIRFDVVIDRPLMTRWL